jgi:hypothetical protein
VSCLRRQFVLVGLMRYVGNRLNSLLPIHALDFQTRHIATTIFSGGYRCCPLLSVRWSGFVAKIMKTWPDPFGVLIYVVKYDLRSENRPKILRPQIGKNYDVKKSAYTKCIAMLLGAGLKIQQV